MTTSDKIIGAIEKQGRKKTWLAEQLQVSRPTLDARLNDDNWNAIEITRLKQLGLLV